MSLADLVDALVPGWAKSKYPWWWPVYRLVAGVVVDGFMEGINQGRRAGMPNAIDLPGVPDYGGFEDVASLDHISHDLGVFRGLTESPPAFALRLRNSQSANLTGGYTAPAILQVFEQLAGALGPTPPLMRIVNGAGDWWTRFQDGHYELAKVDGSGLTWNLDGTITANGIVVVAWNWDGLTAPPPVDAGFLGRWWLILYEPLNTPYGTLGPYTFNDGAVFGHVWNSVTTTGPEPSPWAATFGTNAPAALVTIIFNVILQRQCSGFMCNHVLIALDPNSFKPDGTSTLPAGALGTAYPDGHWGWGTKYDSSTHSRIISRNSTAIYWRMPSDIDIAAHVRFPP